MRTAVMLVTGAVVVVATMAAQPPASNTLRGAAPLTIQKVSSARPEGSRRLASAPTSKEYMDCYADTGSDRVMGNKLRSLDMTSAVCRQHCLDADVDHMYYATQFGVECWCGTSSIYTDYDRHGKGVCDMPCTGNEDETCGGMWSFDLFRIMDDGVEPNSPSPQVDPTPPPEVSVAPDNMAELLDLHNAVRCMHNAAALSYSSTIESTAKAYAKTLVTTVCGEIEHSTSEGRNGYGENLFLCGTSDLNYDCFTARMAMTGFYDKEVTNGPVTEYQGHATQILWKSTKEVGCGLDMCIKDGWRYNVLVCNYNPPGNYVGEVEAEVEKPSKSKSECGY